MVRSGKNGNLNNLNLCITALEEYECGITVQQVFKILGNEEQGHLDYLLIDEEKHNKIMETLETIKKGMYPYG